MSRSLTLLAALFLGMASLFAQPFTEIVPADGTPGNQFGRSIDYDGNLIIAGANDAAYLFELNPATGCFEEVLKMTTDDCPNCYPSNPAGGFSDPAYNVNTLSNFGYKVGLAGGRAFVSFDRFNDTYFAGISNSQTYVYEKTPTGWAYQSTIDGYIIDAEGSTLLVRNNESVLEYFGSFNEHLRLEVYSFGGGVYAALEDEFFTGGAFILPAGAGLSDDGHQVVYSPEGMNYGTFLYDVQTGTSTQVDPVPFDRGDNVLGIEGNTIYSIPTGQAFQIGGGSLTPDPQASLSPNPHIDLGALWYFTTNTATGIVEAFELDFVLDPLSPTGGVFFYNFRPSVQAPTGAGGFGTSIETKDGIMAVGAPSGANGGAVYLEQFGGTQPMLPCFNPCGPIPNTLSSTDIGNTGGIATTICYDQPTGTYDITASGDGIKGTKDGQNLIYQTLTGDGEIVCHITGLDASEARSRVGMMMRASLDDNAAFAFAGQEGDGTNFWKYRAQAGARTTGRGFRNRASWFKVVRSGQLFEAYRSEDGQTWYRMGAKTLPHMPATLYVGIATASPTPGTIIQVQVANVQLNGVAYRQGSHQADPALAGIMSEVALFPNPTADHVMVTGTASSASLGLDLLDASGRLLSHHVLDTQAEQPFQHKLSLQGFPEGLYLLRVSDEIGNQELLSILKQ